MNEDSIRDYLEAKYPGSFESWDGFEMTIKMRDRVGKEGEMLVLLYNKAAPDSLYLVTIHQVFHLTSASDGRDVVRIGGTELVAEYEGAYIAEK